MALLLQDIAAMQEELASLRLSKETAERSLTVQEFELNALRMDNSRLRGRLEREQMQGAVLNNVLNTAASGIISGLKAYAAGQEAAATAASEAMQPKPPAEIEAAAEPASEPEAAWEPEPEQAPRYAVLAPGQKGPPVYVERPSERPTYTPAISAEDHTRTIPARSSPRQVVQKPLAERLAAVADEIGRPHRTPIPGGPGFVEPIDIPLFLQRKA